MPYFGVPIRNGLPIGLGSQAGFGIAPFDPRDLFSAGEQGAWYDPSDFSTLFTDSAGTTPVTAVEQFVGLMLDKSKGLVLGPELVTNGDFSSSAGWTLPGTGTNSITGGQAVLSGASGFLYRTGTNITAGTWYRVSFTVSGYSGSATVRPYVQATPVYGTNVTGNGTFVQYLLATTTNANTEIGLNFSAGFTGNIDDISIKLLPGNHATSTGTKRPKLAARYNLLTYSEQFDNAAWSRDGVLVTANTTDTTDPLGGNTADKVYEVATSAAHVVYATSALAASAVQYTLSCYVKAAERTFARIDFVTIGYAAGSTVILNLSTLATSITNYGATSGTTATVVNAGNGWYRLAMTVSATAANYFMQIGPALSGTPVNYTGVAGNGIYIWGADLRPASQATGLIGPTYQRVVDAATYDTAGFLPYLQFDGIDDSMSTGSIDATAVDKAQVFVGARALSMSLTAMIAEFSASVSANNGSLVIYTENTITFNMLSKGTVLQVAASAVQSPPVTRVLCGIADIAAPLSAIRVDGTQVNNTAAQGAGNFGNYPLFIGMRNNASFPFNGWLSSLIVRFGANLSQSQISATESWVNGRTGAY